MQDRRPPVVQDTARGRRSFIPVLVAYFCYGASALTAVALVFFEKDALGLTPAEAAGVAFWLGLPWSMKMVAGVASDAYPLFGSRRASYLLIGCALSVAGYASLATVVDTRAAYLLAMICVTVGFMMQDVVADALSVEAAATDEEIAQIQTWGRMALLAGGISVGYAGGWLAGAIGARGTFATAIVLPVLVAATVPFIARQRPARGAPADSLVSRRSMLILSAGVAYALFSVVLQMSGMPLAQEAVLVVSAALLVVLLRQVGISRGIAIAAIVIFTFRATPTVGQGYSFWAIDRLGFDERFLGVLAQVGAVLSLLGLLVFRRVIVTKPVSATLFWVIVAGAVLYLPNIGLFYGLHEWVGVSARTLAFIDTTISAPLAQLAMVPMLVLIARSAPPGAEATMFAIMASLMNLALSASQLFTQYLNVGFGVSQADYSNLGRLMIAVGMLGLAPLLVLPLLRRAEGDAAAVPRS